MHRGTFGSAEHSQVPDYELAESNGSIHFTVTTFLKDEGKPGTNTREVAEVPTTYSVYLPYLAAMKEQLRNNRARNIAALLQPVTARRCHLYMLLTRDLDFDSPLEEWLEYQQRVNEEDRVIIEAQHPLELPVFKSQEVHVPADRFSMAYRSRLRALGMDGHSEHPPR